jgi:hypothetical protein
MADRITTMQSNSDGSYDFGFLFDGGNGITAATSVHVPAPMGTPAVLDPNGNVITPAVAAVPYTAQTAAAASLPIAAAQKAVWLASVAGASVIGNVVLP